MNTRRRLLAAGALALAVPRLFAAPGSKTIGSNAELGFAELPDGALAEQELFALRASCR